ncbi:hypothetical protein [Hasllibacter sp. MH4015]|uniref:hypothetical protein n=1 Tax=Hasllibacter sp. MH4015 TaxID=2854029 RepID=UPI001CD23413|nr:hypothetical protein [Hasllibacter sp. MH4015]
MRGRATLGIAMLVAGAVGAQTLDGAGITALLTDRIVTYENGATQRFYPSGRTLYTHGEPSWGEWRVEADRYCSLWPPAPDWDCYDVSADGDAVNFMDDWGNDFPGTLSEP